MLQVNNLLATSQAWVPYFLFITVIESKDSTCFISSLNLTLTKLTFCVANINMIPLSFNMGYNKAKQYNTNNVY